MGSGAGTTKEKQSWNDQFEAFMVKKDNQIEEHKGSDDRKEELEGEERDKAEAVAENEFIDDKRLFVMNLSYQVTKEELQDLFGKHGEIIDIEIPFRKHGKGVPLGIGFIRFATTEATISAFAQLDKTYFQGRKIHIKPAERKPPQEEAQVPFDQQYQQYPEDHPEYKYQQEQM